MDTIHDAEIKLVQSELNMNLLKDSLAHTINSLPSCIQDKIFTHSLSGLSVYSKQFLLNKYGSNCQTLKDDKTEENTFEILQHSDRNINNS